MKENLNNQDIRQEEKNQTVEFTQDENNKMMIGRICAWISIFIFSYLGTSMIYTFIFGENRVPDLADQGDFGLTLLLIPFFLITPVIMRATSRLRGSWKRETYYAFMAFTTLWISVLIAAFRVDLIFVRAGGVMVNLLIAALYALYLIVFCLIFDLLKLLAAKKLKKKTLWSIVIYILQIFIAFVAIIPVTDVILFIANLIIMH